MVPARLPRRLARMVAHPISIDGKLLRATSLSRTATAARAQARAGHAPTRTVDPVGAPQDGQRVRAGRLCLRHLRHRGHGAL